MSRLQKKGCCYTTKRRKGEAEKTGRPGEAAKKNLETLKLNVKDKAIRK